MPSYWQLTFVLVCAGTILAENVDLNEKEASCLGKKCGAGQQCAVVDGIPECICRKYCKPRRHPVCGSDGRTYLNKCEFHRSACLLGQKIRIEHHKPCEELDDLALQEKRKSEKSVNKEKDEKDDNSPLVCYQLERDELRQLMIDWLEGKVVEGSWMSRGTPYEDVLDSVFEDCDVDRSRDLTAEEFLECTEKNETVRNSGRGATSQILRGLCVDALIYTVDDNSDWKLDSQEFFKLMDPHFTPPKRECSLEDKTYEDGAETNVSCNLCICACGNWVCTGAPCAGGEDGIPSHVKQGQLPTQKQANRILKGFRASDSVSLERVRQEVEDPRTKSRPHDTDNYVQELKRKATDDSDEE